MNVAIIGAGASGLVSARFCTDPSFNFSCEIFEQTDELGGTWVYTPRTGLDDYGIPIHTSMYSNLVTNLPKEVMEFPDFKFPNYEHSFLTQEEVLKYLQDYSKYFNLHQYIKFHHFVKKVKPLPNNKWQMTITNLQNKTDFVKEYDAVLVCNGHYSKPIIPEIPGKKFFKGTQIHSHNYRNSEAFKGKIVLVIGGGPSGVDITTLVSKLASKVILSHRNQKLTYKFSSNVVVKPATTELKDGEVVFSDGTSEKIDALIYCTGFEYSFPFLSEECGITVDKNAVQPLYKHVVNIEKPSMAFIGLPFLVLPFPEYHYQVLMYFKYLKRLITLPTKEEMLVDLENDLKLRKEKGYLKKHTHKLGADFQQTYFNDLAKIAKVKPLPPVKFKIYADCSMKYNKTLIYKIIDDENFLRL